MTTSPLSAVACLGLVAATLLLVVAPQPGGAVVATSAAEKEARELRSAQENYIELNRVLKENVPSENVEANFKYAHDLKTKQANPIGPALDLFVKLGELKEFYSCNAEDTKWLIKNQDALVLVDKNDRASKIFNYISFGHASKCQEDYEERFARLKLKWDDTQQQKVSAVMDPFIMQLQQQDQLQKRRHKQASEEAARPTPLKIPVKSTLEQAASDKPQNVVEPPAAAAAASDSSKNKIKSYLGGAAFMNIGHMLGDHHKKVIKKRDVGAAIGPYDIQAAPSPPAASRPMTTQQARLDIRSEEFKRNRANASLLKRFIGAGILLAHKQRQQSSNTEARPAIPQAGVEQANGESQKEAAVKKEKSGGFLNKLGTHLPFIGQAQKQHEKPAKKADPLDDDLHLDKLFSNPTNNNKKDSTVADQKKEAARREAHQRATEMPLLPLSAYMFDFFAKSKPQTGGQPAPAPTQTNKQEAPATTPAPTPTPAVEPLKVKKQAHERTRDKLSISITKRMIASGKYYIDKVKGSRTLATTLMGLANQRGMEFSIKSDRDRARERANIERFVEENVLEACEKFHAHFAPVFQVAKFDLKYNGRSSSTNDDFYGSFAEYQLCDSFLEQKNELIHRIIKFALEDIVFQPKPTGAAAAAAASTVGSAQKSKPEAKKSKKQS